jgi:hypothetical protein
MEVQGWRIEFWDPERGYMQAERNGVRLWAFGRTYREAYWDLLDEIKRRDVDGGALVSPEAVEPSAT